MAVYGSFYPKQKSGNFCGWRCEGDFLEVSGFLDTELHPSEVGISDSRIRFDYSIDDEAVSREYGISKSGGKISSVTFPDGFVMEVKRL